MLLPAPRNLVLLVACLISLALEATACIAIFAADPGIEFFEAKIRPVLVERCYKCHSEETDKPKGGLRLDSREAVRGGGDSGAAVVPEKPADSLLLSALRYESFEMPPDGRLPPETIADFERWIQMGAPDPRDGVAPAVGPKPMDWNSARQFWAFQPPQRHPQPAVKTPDWIQRPHDAFVLQQLDAAGVKPNLAADRRTLMRRVTFDLTGLPPSIDDVEPFLRDESPLAYERLVDRLLAMPQAGERWARLWLDLARYGEDQAHIVGNDRSLCYPNAYLYRDWVIAALNADLPYNEFVRRQLAADVLDPEDKAGHAALGFIGLGPKYYRRNAPEVMADEWEDRVDIVGRGLLGLTIACARCHDHKYDPIPTADYYALAGVFASTEMFNRPLDEKAELDKNGHAKQVEQAMHLVRDIKPRDLNVQVRGDFKQLGAVAKRGFLRVLSPTGQPVEFKQGSGRLDLAEAIVQRNNPLTARVIVNRVWGQLIGQALVGTPSNFGSLGDAPSHSDLLDDLAVRFMEAGWSLKWLQREIVLSASYQQGSQIDPAKQALDAANRLLGRMNRRRLTVEAWRDSILAIAGRLDSRIGGPSMEPQDPKERRRTLYSQVSRLKLDSMLAMFDFPDPNVHSERRSETITPLQKLFTLNSPFMLQQAESLAEQLVMASQDDGSRIDAAYRQAFAREPTAAEKQLGMEFLATCGEADETRRWTQFAQVLFASNELLIID